MQAIYVTSHADKERRKTRTRFRCENPEEINYQEDLDVDG
jgi:hypothetical protein